MQQNAALAELLEFNLNELEYQEGQTKIKVSKASKGVENIKTGAIVSPNKSVLRVGYKPLWDKGGNLEKIMIVADGYYYKGKTISSNHGPSSFHLSELLRFSSSIKPVKAVSALIMRSTSQSSILNSVNKPCFSSASFFCGC